MSTRTIICLANSRKPPSGRCVAGKQIEARGFGAWIRPVSARQGHEVSDEERRYEDGKLMKLLDIVSVPLLNAAPELHQVENYVLDDTYYWVKQGGGTWDQVVAAVDPHDPAFWANSESTYHGTNDKVSESAAPHAGSSLKLIKVSDLRLLVRREEGYSGLPARRRVRGSFTYNGASYLLSVTDVEIEDLFMAKQDGHYDIGHALVCISLAEVWKGYAFRVIASIITPRRCEGYDEL